MCARLKGMQVGKISYNSFGLNFKDNAMAYFENRYRTKPRKLLEVDRVEAMYPEIITVDLVDLNSNKGATSDTPCPKWVFKDGPASCFLELSLKEAPDISDITKALKSFVKMS